MELDGAQSISRMKDPISLLNELYHKNRPVYELVRERPYYSYKVTAGGETAYGFGSCKKEAKHNAAYGLLDEIKIFLPRIAVLMADVESPFVNYLKGNFLFGLYKLCHDQDLGRPNYVIIGEQGPAHAKVFSATCTVAVYTTLGSGRSKKYAKRLAARDMLFLLNNDQGVFRQFREHRE